MNSIKLITLATCLLLVTTCVAEAAVHVKATRVVYQGKSASASVGVSNNGDTPYVVQTWLDDGDASKVPTDLPVAIMPPLLRLNPGEEALLRAIYRGDGLPRDQESLFWINIQEIPPKSEKANSLQVAIRTRIKLFYRPVEINSTLEDAAKSLQWTVTGDTVHIKNPSPLHITFDHIQDRPIGRGKGSLNVDMIAPGTTVSVPSRHLNVGPDTASVRFGYINDQGGVSELAGAPLRR